MILEEKLNFQFATGPQQIVLNFILDTLSADPRGFMTFTNLCEKIARELFQFTVKTPEVLADIKNSAAAAIAIGEQIGYLHFIDFDIGTGLPITINSRAPRRAAGQADNGRNKITNQSRVRASVKRAMSNLNKKRTTRKKL